MVVRPVESVPITTKVLCWNYVHGEMHSIQHYVISLSVICSSSVVSPGNPVPYTNKADRHDIAEIFLKVELDIITLTPSNMITMIIL